MRKNKTAEQREKIETLNMPANIATSAHMVNYANLPICEVKTEEEEAEKKLRVKCVVFISSSI